MLSTTSSAAAGRVAVVTGANKGIGYFVALHLALSGLFEHVLLACRDATRASLAVQAIEAELMRVRSSSSDATSSTNPVHVSSWAPLHLGDAESHQRLADHLEQTYGRLDVLVNNAAFAYKNSDPTPFQEQCHPTLAVNFYGTIDLTERLLPLLRRGADARVVSVASMAGRLSQLSSELQEQFSAPTLTLPRLKELVHDFESAVQDGTHRSKGWGNSNYGLSKLAVIAATRIWARQEEENNHPISFHACCPGYCKTDMTSQQGIRNPADGARNAVLPATLPHADLPVSGSYWADYQVSEW